MENRGDLIPHCMGRALLLLSKHYKNAQTLIPKHIESTQKKKKMVIQERLFTSKSIINYMWGPIVPCVQTTLEEARSNI